MIPLHLYCVQGKERGQRFPMHPDSDTIIGRDPGADGLQFLDIMASRQHIHIQVCNGFIHVTDLDSANGTRVNGQDLKGSTDMYPGDIMTLGNTSLILEDPMHSSQVDEVTRMSRQHRTSQRLKAQHQTQLLETHESTNDTDEHEFLVAMLETMPLAAAIFDNDDHVLIANNLMKHLCNIEISAGHNAHTLFAHFAQQLHNPGIIRGLLEQSQSRPVLLQGNENHSYSAWSHISPQLKVLYILDQSVLE